MIPTAGLATDAISVLLLLHVPPAGPSVSVRVEPKHICLSPVIVPGCGFTVTTVVAAQPVPNV
jgi:hypothetical protein